MSEPEQAAEAKAPRRWSRLRAVGLFAALLVLALVAGYPVVLRAHAPRWAVVLDLAAPGRGETILRGLQEGPAAAADRDPWGTPYELADRSPAIVFVDGLELVSVQCYPDRVLRSAGPDRRHQGGDGDDVLVHALASRPRWLELLASSPLRVTLTALLAIAWLTAAPALERPRGGVLRELLLAAAYALPMALSLAKLFTVLELPRLPGPLGWSKTSAILSAVGAVYLYFLAVRLTREERSVPTTD